MALPQYQRPNLRAVAAGRDTLEQIVGSDPLPHLKDGRAEIRRLAVAGSARLGQAAFESLVATLDEDSDDEVRAAAIEILGGLGPRAFDAVWGARDDPSMRVVEAAVSALGEIGQTEAVPWLIEAVPTHQEPLVREAAVAALGAIGDQSALPTLLQAARSGKPQIRRRALVALTAFEGPEVVSAFTAARLDRNPMVREIAEMVLGREVAGKEET
jgi:HEAT repeat protein